MSPKERKKITSPELVNYRVSLLEEGQLKHEDRLRKLEDFVTREDAAGVPLKTVWLIAGIVATVIGAVITAILEVYQP